MSRVPAVWVATVTAQTVIMCKRTFPWKYLPRRLYPTVVIECTVIALNTDVAFSSCKLMALRQLPSVTVFKRIYASRFSFRTRQDSVHSRRELLGEGCCSRQRRLAMSVMTYLRRGGTVYIVKPRAYHERVRYKTLCRQDELRFFYHLGMNSH